VRFRTPDDRSARDDGAMSPRPTTDVRVALLDTFDDVWDALTGHLAGIGQDEYLWEPVTGDQPYLR
jgi:hypothetical protein